METVWDTRNARKKKMEFIQQKFPSRNPPPLYINAMLGLTPGYTRMGNARIILTRQFSSPGLFFRQATRVYVEELRQHLRVVILMAN